MNTTETRVFSSLQLHPQVVQRLTGPLPPPSHPPISSTHPLPKVPIITNYAPQLPMGPGPILQFPFPYPPQAMVAASTSAPPVSSHDPAHQRRAESVETAVREPKQLSSREEDLALQMRHQQQQHLKLVQAQQQQQQHAAHAQLVTAHPMQGERLREEVRICESGSWSVCVCTRAHLLVYMSMQVLVHHMVFSTCKY